MLSSKQPISINRCDDALLVLTSGDTPRLWRITGSADGETTTTILEYEPAVKGIAACLNGSVYFTDFHGGRVLRLTGKQVTEVATGLRNPGEMAIGSDGSIYIAEFGRGAVRRLLS